MVDSVYIREDTAVPVPATWIAGTMEFVRVALAAVEPASMWVLVSPKLGKEIAMIGLLISPITLPCKLAWVALIFIGVLLATGCAGPVHNDQRSCTHDCNIGSSEPVYAPAVVHGPVYRRGWRRRAPVVIYHW